MVWGCSVVFLTVALKFEMGWLVGGFVWGFGGDDWRMGLWECGMEDW